jgi:hypothetical protein
MTKFISIVQLLALLLQLALVVCLLAAISSHWRLYDTLLRRHQYRQECRVKENAFGRWILVHPQLSGLGWTGSGWAQVDTRGFPAEDFQISNFDNATDAAAYADKMGLKVLEFLDWRTRDDRV